MGLGHAMEIIFNSYLIVKNSSNEQIEIDWVGHMFRRCDRDERRNI